MDETNNSKNSNVGIIVLAAGASRRLKTPKQLVRFKGKTLLRRAVETALESNCRPVVVVLGAELEKMKAEIEELDVFIGENPDWPGGLSSSIKCGLENLLKIDPHVSAVILTLADQPLVTAGHLKELARQFEKTRNSIVAAEYRGTRGVPALFARQIFGELLELSGDRGAKMIMEKRREALGTIDVPEAAFDIDTPQDLLILKSQK